MKEYLPILRRRNVCTNDVSAEGPWEMLSPSGRCFIVNEVLFTFEVLELSGLLFCRNVRTQAAGLR